MTDSRMDTGGLSTSLSQLLVTTATASIMDMLSRQQKSHFTLGAFKHSRRQMIGEENQ